MGGDSLNGVTWMLDGKKCGCCQIWKPFHDFYKNRSQPDGLGNQCKECANASIKKYESTPKGKQVKFTKSRKYSYKSKYGKTIEDYDKKKAEEETVKNESEITEVGST